MSVRIQFDIEDEEYKEMEPFILGIKSRHMFGHRALRQWINREKGRLKRSGKLKEDEE